MGGRAIMGAAALALTGLAGVAQAQPNLDARMAAQKEAMKPLAWLDGTWRGPAYSMERSGKLEMSQTERVGPFLEGSVKVIEGKAFGADGRPNGWDALGVITYDPDARTYTFHTYARSYSRDVPLTVTPDGWSWEADAGPGRKTRYVTSNAGGRWTETGTMTGPNLPPQGVQIFHMELTRTGATDWPAGGREGMDRAP